MEPTDDTPPVDGSSVDNPTPAAPAGDAAYDKARRQEWRHVLDTTSDHRAAGNPTDPTELTAAPAVGDAPAAPITVSATTPAASAPTVRRSHIADPNDLALATAGLRVGFAGKEILHGVDIHAPRGGVVALVGPSGCGKTTLLRSLNRLTELAPTAEISGQVLVDGSDIYAPKVDLNLLRRRVGMVFQQPNPFPMSIFDNVAFAIREQARKRPTRGSLMPQVEHALERAGLWHEVKDNLDRSALSLSGGQQQRLCIARTLAADPEILLMDEPCSALDPRSTARIEELIVQLAGSLTVIIVTHNLAQARRIADYAAFLLNGDVIEEGFAEQVFESPTQQQTADFVAGIFG
jgi:phosphate transport system ATP-binding protein